MSERKNYFIVVEGLDGSGKTALSERLAATLRRRLGEEQVVLTCEPNLDFCAGNFLRQALARQVLPVDNWTWALAFAANRADHTTRLITPFLEGGAQRVVISDRYYLSSLVYQTGLHASPEQVMLLNRAARKPDLILFLNASNDVCYERMNRREKDPEVFEDQLEELRDKYRALIVFLRGRGELVEEVNADEDIPTVLQTLITLVEHHGPPWLRRETNV